MNTASWSNPSIAFRRARPRWAIALACVVATGACSFRDLDHFQDGLGSAGGGQASGGTASAEAGATTSAGSISANSSGGAIGAAGGVAGGVAGGAASGVAGGAAGGSTSPGGTTTSFGGSSSGGGKATGGAATGGSATAVGGTASLGPWTFDTEPEISTWHLYSMADGDPGPGTASWTAQGESTPFGSLVVKSTGEVGLWYYPSANVNLSGRTLCLRGRAATGSATVKLFAFSPGSQWASGGEVYLQTIWKNACLSFSAPFDQFPAFDPAQVSTLGIQMPYPVTEVWIDKIWLS